MPDVLGQKHSVAFLDRDGVINKNAAPHEYITRVPDFQYNDGIFELLRFLRDAGYVLIVITNQRGIALGKMAISDLDLIHEKLKSDCKAMGVPLTDIFFCPHDYNQCNCRKPLPGMLEAACAMHNIDLLNSLLISDSQEDVTMGETFGLTSILVSQNHPLDALRTLEQKHA
jgi:D-glycero-D-manno-heptose 1,7-bisphosphate phosphatase